MRRPLPAAAAAGGTGTSAQALFPIVGCVSGTPDQRAVRFGSCGATADSAAVMRLPRHHFILGLSFLLTLTACASGPADGQPFAAPMGETSVGRPTLQVTSAQAVPVQWIDEDGAVWMGELQVVLTAPVGSEQLATACLQANWQNVAEHCRSGFAAALPSTPAAILQTGDRVAAELEPVVFPCDPTLAVGNVCGITWNRLLKHRGNHVWDYTPQLRSN